MTASRGKLCAFMLVASLALNLFLGGVFATRLFRRPPPSFEPGGFSVFRMRRTLGPEAAPALDKVWARHDADLKARVRAAAEARARATQALTAEPFDADKASAALADFRAKAAEVQETMHGAVVELAAELTPEQRRRLAAALDRPGAGPMGGHGRRGPRMGAPGSAGEAWPMPAPQEPSAPADSR